MVCMMQWCCLCMYVYEREREVSQGCVIGYDEQQETRGEKGTDRIPLPIVVKHQQDDRRAKKRDGV
jgi:hypothetical protein